MVSGSVSRVSQLVGYRQNAVCLGPTSPWPEPFPTLLVPISYIVASTSNMEYPPFAATAGDAACDRSIEQSSDGEPPGRVSP
jgi:hypothetical protein